jgi:hypothetical protein
VPTCNKNLNGSFRGEDWIEGDPQESDWWVGKGGKWDGKVHVWRAAICNREGEEFVWYWSNLSVKQSRRQATFLQIGSEAETVSRFGCDLQQRFPQQTKFSSNLVFM